VPFSRPTYFYVEVTRRERVSVLPFYTVIARTGTPTVLPCCNGILWIRLTQFRGSVSCLDRVPQGQILPRARHD
jgi:hypothetical protein